MLDLGLLSYLAFSAFLDLRSKIVRIFDPLGRPRAFKSPPHRVSVPGVSDQYALIYCTKVPVLTCLGGGQQSQRIKLSQNVGRPGVHVGAFFRSWALLGCILSVLLRFLSVLAGFCASYRAPDPVFGGFREGPGMVFKVPGPHFLRCFRDRELSMRLGS